jgi:tetratricopeptide (TPR) repeat protein
MIRSHLLIWSIAGAAVVVAAAVALLRQQSTDARVVPVSPDRVVAAALQLIEADPSASFSSTRNAVRAAAVEVERGAVRSAEGYYLLGMQYKREHNISAAEVQFKRAIAMDPGWVWPYLGLGALLGSNALGRQDEAVEVLRRAVEIAPEWSRAYNSLAVVLRITGQYEEAEEAALKALELDPEDVANQNNYANLLMEIGRLEEAEQYFRNAIAISPEHPKPYYNLACLYSVEGQTQDAIFYLDQAIQLAEFMRNEARLDPDFDSIREDPAFRRIVYEE